jgi:uncharacterized protein (TIGR03790 family)
MPQADRLSANQLAVIVNGADPLSGQIADYYRLRRQIPASNIIHVSFPPGRPVMSAAAFRKIKTAIDAKTPPRVQAYVLTWVQPYRVECMSITTAFAAGFDRAYCSQACGRTRPNPYFNSDSHAPYTELGLRPTIVLAGRRFEDAKRLIDRGVASDGSFPSGTGYLLSTDDAPRNVRAAMYPTIVRSLMDRLDLKVVNANYIENRDRVLFYFTGVATVERLESIGFLPGAIADHLTSAGGQLVNSSQMSALRWLEAGATGSYGTVVEPCNHQSKFPSPGILMRHYLRGDSLIEAYWKSVAWPGEGIFVGEPLAAPFAPRRH